MEIYSIHIHKKVKKFLLQHRGEQITKDFTQAVTLLKQNYRNPLLDIKYLSGFHEEHYRLRLGKYRFLYHIDHGEITIQIYDAGSRGNIYK